MEGGGGLESVIFFTKNPYLKQNFFLGGGGGRGADGVGMVMKLE